MNCVEFELELNRVVDRQVAGEAEALQRHAAECATCRKALDEARLLTEAIAAWRGAVPDVDLADTVVVACAEQTPGRSPTFGHWEPAETGRRAQSSVLSVPGIRHRSAAYATLVALAGMLLVAISLMKDGPTGPATSGPGHPGHSVATRSENAPGLRGEEPELALFDQAGDAYGRLARSAAGALEEFAVIVIPGAGTSAARSPSIDSAEEGLVDGLPRQLQPIGRSLGDALNFLWEVGAPPADSRT